MKKRISSNQVMQALNFAKSRISYCLAIYSYIRERGKEWNPQCGRNVFYQHLCNAMFTESLLVIHTLLYGKEDELRFRGWIDPKISQSAADKLKEVGGKYSEHGFPAIRHQMLAHIDMTNAYNLAPFFRLGAVREGVVISLSNIVGMLELVFFEYTTAIRETYCGETFATDNIFKRVHELMTAYPPELYTPPWPKDPPMEPIASANSKTAAGEGVV